VIGLFRFSIALPPGGQDYNMPLIKGKAKTASRPVWPARRGNRDGEAKGSAGSYNQFGVGKQSIDFEKAIN
jgi:hypothetical protein